MTGRKIVLIAGTRPEVIKLAPLYFALRATREFQPVFVSTGQHREMLDQAFAAFEVAPDVEMGLMQRGQSLSDLTAKIVTGVSGLLAAWKPDAVIVQGDTTTMFASALAASYARIPIGHVEAGLRTHDLESPWPEEMNRRLVAPLCRWCFAPTDGNRANLIAEGIPADRVYVTGNTVVDALLHIRRRQSGSLQPETVAVRCGISSAFAARHLNDLPPRGRWLLVTGHRRESFGRGLEDICLALSRLTDRYADLGILFPVHLNPEVQEPVRRLLGNNPRIALIGPVSYGDFTFLLGRSTFVLSDSGGIQEEASTLGKPLIVMREKTERPEGIAAGTAVLAGTSPDGILDAASRLLDSEQEYKRRCAIANPYGDGRSAQKMTEIISRAFV